MVPSELTDSDARHVTTCSDAKGRLDDALAAYGSGAHILLVYRNQQEQFDAAIPFLQIGMKRGEKCVYAADDNPADAVLAALRKRQTGVNGALQTGSLAVVSKEESFLRQGRFDPDAMMTYLQETYEAARNAGYPGLRFTGEMTWALAEAPGTERLLEYESRLGEFLDGRDCLYMCQYNQSRFPAQVLLDNLEVHPIVISGGTVIRNSLYCHPAPADSRSERAARKLEACLGSLREWERTQVALREKEEQYRTVADAIGGWEYWLGPDGRFVYVSPSCEQITGYRAEEFLADTSLAEHIVQPDDVVAYVLHRNEVLEHKTRESSALEFRIVAKDGSVRWIEHRCRAVYREDGTWAGQRGSNRDITRQKHTDAALRDAQVQTADLVMRAEVAARAKREFLANVNHEIRTPMNGIVGVVDLLLDTGLTTTQQHYAGIIRQGTERLLTSVSDILDMSEIEAGGLDLETLDFDLHAAIEGAVEQLADKAREKGLALTWLIETNVPVWVRGDPGRLRQIIASLLDNAVKFTFQGEVSLHVSVEGETTDVVIARFDVIDTGIGIPKNRLDGLFDAFTQVDGSTTRRFGGLGLGLAIARGLVEMMDGRIGVQSEEGKGSTFRFNAVFKKQSQRAPHAGGAAADIRGRRVLVAESNAADRHVLATLLRSWSCLCEEVQDASAALEKLHAAREKGVPFEAIIVGMEPPDLDGEHLGQTIKADPALCDTRLIMLTPLGNRGDVARMKRIGFAAYLTKPIEHAQLRQCLAVILARGPGVGEDTEPQVITRHTLAELRRQ